MGASGTATLDFGAYPGATDATVAVTGQGAIVAGSLVGAWIRPPATYPATILADNPLGYWRLGEPSGTNANDLGSGNHDGTYTNGPTLGVAGALVGDADTGVDFTGSAPARYVDVAGYVAIPALISVEAWFKATGFSDMGLAGWYSSGALEALLYLSGSAQFEVNGTAITFYDPVLETGWHHMVGTHDGTNARLYIDGVLVAGPTAITFSGGTSSFNFNIANYGNVFSANFVGSADEVAVYDYVLSAAQVLAHYEAGARGSHSADEHRVEELFVVADTIVAGTGFTIYGRTGNFPLYGAWSCAWAWS